MPRTKGSKNRKVRSDKGKARKNNIVPQSLSEEVVVEEKEEVNRVPCHCGFCTYVTLDRPSLKYDINKAQSKGIEKRIRTLIKRAKSFWLETNVFGEYSQYFVDSGGWVNATRESKSISHINNLLPFLGGTNPVWGTVKRTYTRHNVRRGIYVKGRT